VRSDAAEKLSAAEAGIPSLTGEWSAADYGRAAEIVCSGVMALPRLSGEEGRSLLQKFTAAENLARCGDRKRTLAQRGGDFGVILSGANSLAKRYDAAMAKGEKVHAEAAQLMAFVIRCVALGVELSDEVLPTFPKDEKYAVRVDGVKKMYEGFTELVMGVQMIFSEKDAFSAEDRSVLLAAMAEVMPVVKKAFVPGAKADFRRKLEAHRATFPAPQDSQRLERLIGELGS
jgi:hypothetical protein